MHARANHVAHRRRVLGHPVKIRRTLHVLRRGVPVIALAGDDGELAPVVVALEDVGVFAFEHLLADARRHRRRDLVVARPDFAQVHRLAVAAGAERLGRQIDVHAPGERVGDDERRRGEIVRANLRVDAALEVAVARQHRGDDQVGVGDGLRDVAGQRAGVADARRAAVADQVEPELVEVFLQAGLGEIIGDDFRAGRQRRLHPRPRVQAALDRVACQQSGADEHRRIRRVGAAGDRGDHHRSVVNVDPSSAR